jgi:short-subunit dehydrogenase
MESLSAEVIEKTGNVDILVNNAGVLVLGEFTAISLADFQWLMGINFWGVMHGAMYFLPHMIERRSGHIVNISSANGLFPLPYSSIYNVSKSAVITLSVSLRAEVSRFGIGVSVVCPGLTHTSLHEDTRYLSENVSTREFLFKYRDRVARIGCSPAKVADKVVRAVRRNRALVKVSAETHLMAWMNRCYPGLSRFIVGQIIGRTS